MEVVIYNLDKVDRAEFELKVNNKTYKLLEPTVKMFAEIKQLDFENEDNLKKLITILCPELKKEIENLTQYQFNLLVRICFKLVRGEGRKKTLEVEELME